MSRYDMSKKHSIQIDFSLDKDMDSSEVMRLLASAMMDSAESGRFNKEGSATLKEISIAAYKQCFCSLDLPPSDSWKM